MADVACVRRQATFCLRCVTHLTVTNMSSYPPVVLLLGIWFINWMVLFQLVEYKYLSLEKLPKKKKKAKTLDILLSLVLNPHII